MEKISVLMSVFNEDINFLKQSLDSIINQTYPSIEIILVNDNPNRKDVDELISQLNCEKLVYIKNEKNIGLAESMNIALKNSTGEYVARMDADDISELTRLEKEIVFLINNGYDYVCSQYSLIDENNKGLEAVVKRYHNPIVNDLLPYGNTIHHPTVLFKKSVLECVGGYRNFPCAQDYDLWLRLYEKGFKVGIIEEELLKYRIHNNSVSGKNKFKQFTTLIYIQKLYKRRKKGLTDNFSTINYEQFLKKRGIYNKNYIERLEKLSKYKAKMDINKNNKVLYIFRLIVLLIQSKYYRMYYSYVLNFNVREKMCD